MTLAEETQLVLAAKSDLASFETLYKFYLPKIYSYCRNRVAGKEQAEDIVSQVFLSAIEKLNNYTQKEKVSFGAWLYRIAHNKIVDYYRKHKFVSDNDQIEKAATDVSIKEADKELLRNQLQTQIAAVLIVLKPRYQEIITYRFYSELEIAEIALLMKIKQQHVNVLLHRSLQSFKKQFQKKFPETEIFEFI